jgi:hypothetical protein
VPAGTYEINQNKKDVDIRPGAHFALDYGVSQFLPAGPGLLEVGLPGYSQRAGDGRQGLGRLR